MQVSKKQDNITPILTKEYNDIEKSIEREIRQDNPSVIYIIESTSSAHKSDGFQPIITKHPRENGSGHTVISVHPPGTDDSDIKGSRLAKRKQLCKLATQKMITGLQPRLRFLISITEELFDFDMHAAFLEMIEQFLTLFDNQADIQEIASFCNFVFTETSREPGVYREIINELEHVNNRVIKFLKLMTLTDSDAQLRILTADDSLVVSEIIGQLSTLEYSPELYNKWRTLPFDVDRDFLENHFWQYYIQIASEILKVYKYAENNIQQTGTRPSGIFQEWNKNINLDVSSNRSEVDTPYFNNLKVVEQCRKLSHIFSAEISQNRNHKNAHLATDILADFLKIYKKYLNGLTNEDVKAINKMVSLLYLLLQINELLKQEDQINCMNMLSQYTDINNTAFETEVLKKYISGFKFSDSSARDIEYLIELEKILAKWSGNDEEVNRKICEISGNIQIEKNKVFQNGPIEPSQLKQAEENLEKTVETLKKTPCTDQKEIAHTESILLQLAKVATNAKKYALAIRAYRSFGEAAYYDKIEDCFSSLIREHAKNPDEALKVYQSAITYYKTIFREDAAALNLGVASKLAKEHNRSAVSRQMFLQYIAYKEKTAQFLGKIKEWTDLTPKQRFEILENEDFFQLRV